MVSSPMVERPIRIARAAVFTVFALNGFLFAMWVVHIPVVIERTGVEKPTLGMFILLMAGAGIAGMRLAGPLADRFGSRALVGTAACVASVAVLGPGLATGPVSLALALTCFGFGNGALDVSMNTQAVHVERAYRRPIMAAFHALFSGGGLLGSLVGAATLRAGWDVRVTLALAALGCVALTVTVVPRLLGETALDTRTAEQPPLPGPAAHPTEGGAALPNQALGRHDTTTLELERAVLDVRPEHNPPPVGSHTASAVPPLDEPGRQTAETALRTAGADGRDHGRKVVALAMIAFALLLAEGVAADWSTLQMREHLGADEATAALAFGAFSTTMTVGRFGTDRVSQMFGRVAVVRYGALIAAIGSAVIIVSPWIPLSLLGWAMAGLGLSGGIPQIFTAAGNLGSDTAATDMSRVFSVGYLGLLAGPTVIGWLTAVIPLTAAMVVPLVAMLLCCRYASVVAPTRNPLR
ncbi:MFS transporter [Nocardia sp. R6R-6]|uniref:MFS transporter n=1 Tax=Nocardia sp. R6R-6 TaxID=3459303 RepID=UPI00403E2419